MTIQLDDIILVDIPDKVLVAARELNPKLFGNKKQSAKYRPLREDHNEVGLIGHWAVEVVLARWQIPFETTRRIKYKNGDEYDLKIEEKLIDVKSSSIGKWDSKYFYNMDFFVLKDWTDDPKGDLIDDYIFVHLNRELTEARLFGVLPRSELLECPVMGPCEWPPANLKYENYHVKSRQLISFYKYIYRT